MEIVKSIAEKVAEPIIDYSVAPIARQVSYLIFYKDNFKNLKDQYTDLKRVNDTISHEVEVERKNGRQIYDSAQNWLSRVDEIVEEAEQLSNDPRHRNVACCKGPFPNFKSRHQLSRKAKKMARNIVEVMQQKDNIGPLAFLPDLEGVGSTSATSSEKLESRKKIKEDIVLALRDPHISRVGVYGLGGVGKSTLVKEVAKQVKDDKLFDKVVMANISQVADLERIQYEIADFLGLRFEEKTIIGKAARLQQRIKNERSILVILDDIWEILELDKLGVPLNDHKGCKLLLISRKLDILQNMETQKDFLVGVLNEEEAWSLFEDMVGDVVKNVNLRGVAIQVAKKCAGLIVLIVTVARALKNKDDIDSWKDALNQLKIVGEEPMSEKIYSAIEFSYNHLGGDDMKEIFLLCGSLYPQIDVEYLLKYVMGLGIFKHINTPKDARLKLHRFIGSLKASCLLLESNSNMKVEMHDIVHEVAVSIASRDQHVFKIGMGGELKKWPSEEFLQRCTQIIIRWCHIPKLLERSIKVKCCDQLKYLFSVPMVNALCQLIEIEVLECRSIKNIVFVEKSLPNSVAVDENIEFGSLQSLTLGYLPAIDDFYSGLSESSTTSMQSLLLDNNVPSSFINSKDDHVSIANSFHKLANLSVEGCSRLKYLFSSSIVGSFPNLKQLEIRECEMMEEIISIEGRNAGAATHEVVLPKLETLLISNMKRLKKIWHSQFDGLKTTEINNCEKLTNIFPYDMQGTFGSLEILKCLFPLEEVICNLETLALTMPSSVTFSHLTSLKVEDCNGLVHLITSSTARSLVTLTTMKISNCNSLEKVVAEEKEGSEDEILEVLDVRSCGVEEIVANEEGLEELKFHFPLLSILWLINLRQLNDFYPKRYTLECPSLKKLNVSQCEALQIFAFEHLGSYQLKGVCGNLPIQQALFHIEKVPENLEEIWLTEKDAMRILNGNNEKKLFQRTKILHLQYFQETPIKFLNDLIQKFPATTTLHPCCSYFKTLFPSEENGHCSIQSPPQIKTLWLSLLEKLEHIWNDNFSLDTLVPNLEHLGIYECCRLIRLAPTLTYFTNLITLDVKDCNGMMDFMSPFTAKSLVHLTHMAVRNCSMLEEVVMSNEGGPQEEIVFKSLKCLELTCLPCFKSFSFGKHTFIFPSLVTLKLTGCHKMQNFSSGIIVAPFLKLVEVENEKKRWKGDLNTTINHLFLEKINGNLNMDTTEASSSKEQVGESKPNQIADIGKQDTQKNEASSGTERPLAQVTQNACSPSTNQDTGIARGTQEMGENIERPSVEVAKVTGVYDADTGKQEIHKLPSESYDTQQNKQASSNQDTEESQDLRTPFSKNLSKEETTVNNKESFVKGTQEMGENVEKPLVDAAKIALSPRRIYDAEESHGSSTGIQEMCDTLKKPSTSVAQNVPSSCSNMIPNAATTYPSPSQAPEFATAQSTGKSRDSYIDTQTAQNFPNYTMIPDAGLTKGTQEMGENIERPIVEATKISPSPIGVYNAGSHESETCSRENLFNQPKILVTCDSNEAVGSQEIHETMDKPLIQSDQHAQKPTTTENTVIVTKGRQEIIDQMPLVQSTQKHIESYHNLEKVNETIEKPLIQTSQQTQRPTGGHDIDIHDTMDKPLIQADQDAKKLATIQSTEESSDSYTGTHKICNTIKKASISAAPDVSNSTMIPEAVIDPSPSQAPEPVVSPTEKLNIFRNYMEMIDIPKQNMSYLEAGVNRHPQVLDWFNTKQRRMFSSSIFSLFAEVTRNLRTTRKGHLTKDDRSYIRKCCNVLEAAGFDVSWLSYVHKCIEECGDAEDIKRKVEENKGQASSLEVQIESMKKELASVKESLVLLLDKARNLDDFIEP
ncbi:hypothetical protein K1719_016720 [Acacia pycnantha]|nr:hypothetical protein K1719_016720 [Acacia pycnantha]